MKRQSRLWIEELERRDLLAVFGVPWPDGEHLTLSFPADGTDVLGQPNQLNSALDSSMGSGAWQSEVLRAFQTWAAYADINIGLVPDSGEALDASGAAQGDPRHGDIRVV